MVDLIRQEWRTRLILPAILVLSAVVFSWRLSERSLWHDEGVSYGIASMPISSAMVVMPREPNMLLYYLLLRLWLTLGNSEAALRSLSVAGAMGTVALTFVSARKWAGLGCGIVASLLLISNPFLIRFAQEARSYALLACAATAAMFFAEEAMRNGTRRSAFRFALLSAVAAYLHVLSALLFIAATLVFLWRRHRLKIFEAGFLYTALTLPLWIVVSAQGQENLAWIPRLSWSLFRTSVETVVGNSGWFPVLVYGAGVAGFVFTARVKREPWHALVLLWALFPGACMIALSLAGHPLFLTRFLIMSLPGLAIIAAQMMMHVFQASKILGAGAAALLIGYVVSFGQPPVNGTDDMRSAVRLIAAQEAPRDAVVVYWWQSIFSYQFYAERFGIRNAVVVCPDVHPPERVFVAPRGDLDRLKASPRVWFVEQANGDDSSAPSLQAIRTQYCVAQDEHTFGSLKVRLCSRTGGALQ